MSLDYDDEYDEPAYRPRRGRLKSSGLGIASFIISVLAGLEIISLLIVGMVMEMRTPGWADEDSPQVMFPRLAGHCRSYHEFGRLGVGDHRASAGWKKQSLPGSGAGIQWYDYSGRDGHNYHWRSEWLIDTSLLTV